MSKLDPFPTVTELQRLLDATGQCAALARAARQRAVRYASYYRVKAEEFTRQAARTHSPELRASLLQLASLYEALGYQGSIPETESDRPPDCEPTGDHATADPVKSPIGSHSLVAEAEDQMKRLQAFLETLPSDDREVALRARIALSRALYYSTLEIIGESRELIDRAPGALPPEGTDMELAATTGELRQLLEITEERAARAATARRRVAKDLSHYRSQVEEFKRQAARTRSPEVRARLLRIAASHERLVRLAESAAGLRTGASEASNRDEAPADAYGEQPMSQRAAEDPIAQARRHVAEAQDHIARQEALVARLSTDDRHAALAAEAREVLATLKRTLSLARQHLAIELKT